MASYPYNYLEIPEKYNVILEQTGSSKVLKASSHFVVKVMLVLLEHKKT